MKSGILDSLRSFISRLGSSPDEEILRRKPLEEVSADKAAESSSKSKASGSEKGPLLFDALRDTVDGVSGSAEKAAESAEKGLKGRTLEALGAKPVDADEKVLRFSNKRLVLLTSMVVVTVIVVFYSFTIWSVGYTSSEKFCISCHEMLGSYQAWKTSSHYKNESGVVATCADCHLPTDMISKIKVKILTGARDSFVHYLGDPEGLDFKELAIKARENIGDDSCVQCHKNPFPAHLSKGGFIAHRALERGTEKKCVDCHKNLVHTRSS